MRDYGLAMSEISYIRVLPVIPWFIKFLFGGVSDNIPICGYHRKPYVVIMNLLSSILCWVLLLPVLVLIEYGSLLTLLSMTCAWADIIYDGMVVEDGRLETDSEKGNLQIKCKYFRSAGRLVATTGPILWDYIGDQGIYILMGVFYFSVSILALFMYDFRRRSTVIATKIHSAMSIEIDSEGNSLNVVADDIFDENTTSKSCCFQLGLVRESFRHPILRRLLCFSVFMALSPSPGIPMFYFINDVLLFSKVQMFLLSFFGEIGQMLGLTIYYRFLMKRPIKMTYVIVTFFSIFISLMPLLLVTRVHLKENEVCNSSYNNETSNQCYVFEHAKIPPLFLSMSDDVFGAISDELRSIPLERVTAIVCITSVEATVFSTMLSIRNFAWAVRSWTDAVFIRFFEVDHGKYEHFPSYIMFCSSFEIFLFFVAFTMPSISIPELIQDLKDKTLNNQPIKFRNVGASDLGTNDEIELYTRNSAIVSHVVDEMVEGDGNLNDIAII